MFNVRLDDDLADRFDAVAALEGGRSALLRRLIADATSAAARPASVSVGPRGGARVMVRLTALDAAGVDAAAAAMGLSRAGWVAALVRRRVRGRPTFPRPEALTLIAIQVELRRVGINVNQIARALNTAVMEGRVLDAELAWARSLRAEIRDHIAGLREAFDGNLVYWETL
ncbi:MAG: plasmid mobilization relaxosome protein MobC [Caulobacter sp.]|nr:plasmid mobilization relaxosome protein MobC [Caulobacter sp.]